MCIWTTVHLPKTTVLCICSALHIYIWLIVFARHVERTNVFFLEE